MPPTDPPAPAPPSPDGPRLEWSADGAPRSARYGDVYFSRDDGLAESRAVFLAGCGLPDAWAGRRTFTVAELGFGTGLNVVALLELWRRTRPRDGRLTIFSVEGYPLSRDEAARALSVFPEAAEAVQALLAVWPRSAPGFHRIDLPAWSATLDLAVGDVEWALGQWSGAADAWFLDGFSPALNPEMWSPGVLDGLAARSAPGARVATFTVAGAVRRGLAERGFSVERLPGHGRKRQRLEARLPSPDPAPGRSAPIPTRVAVIGAGVAGAAVARALAALGVSAVVVEAERPGAGASGFPAGLVTPRLDAGDTVIAALHAQALARAGDLYGRIDGGVIGRGVLQLEQAPRDAVRFGKVADQPIWPQGQMTALDADAASHRLGEPVPVGGLDMASALTVHPAAVLQAWLAGAAVVAGTVRALRPDGAGWSLLDADGAVLARADAVVVAAGWGSAALAEDLGLQPVRGQADWVIGPTPPAVAWGGYVAPTRDGFLFGATHDRDDTGVDVRDADSRRNRAQLHGRLPGLAARVETARVETAPSGARAAIRATTRDRLPVCGALPGRPGVYVLGGLGSRGFCVAPLLGEHLAALIAGAPSPLPAEAAERLSPGRFAPPA